VSLGKVNYCLRALIDKGHVKAENFRKSNNKAAYLYLLTPTGIQAKARITAHYLQSKLDEYKALQAEIEELQAEVSASDS
jgi:EPS-associated MarR family transcriptional regulator